MDRETKLRIKLWAIDICKFLIFILVGSTFGLALYFYLIPYLVTSSQPKKEVADQVFQNIGMTNRAQQAYFLESAKFTNNYNELGFIPQNIDNYQLTIETTGNLAFIYAIPEASYETKKKWLLFTYINTKKSLYGYVGGISYSKDNQIFQAVLCVNQDVGKYRSNPPKIIANQLVCSEGTSQIR